MKFFLVVAALCGISAAFPADPPSTGVTGDGGTSANGVVAGAIATGTDVATGATNAGVNAANAGMNAANGLIQKGMSLVNSAANGGLDIGLSAINGGISIADSGIKNGVGIGVSVVNGIGSTMKGVPVVGGLVQSATNHTASMMNKGASMASSALTAVSNFEKAKFGMMKKGINWTTGKVSSATTSSINLAKSGVNTFGNTTTKAVNSVFSFLG